MAVWAKLLHSRAGAAARGRQPGQGSCEQGGRTGRSLSTPGHKHILCTLCHGHIPAHGGGTPIGSKAGLPSFCKMSFQTEPFPHLAGWHLKFMEPVTNQLKEPFPVTVTQSGLATSIHIESESSFFTGFPATMPALPHITPHSQPRILLFTEGCSASAFSKIHLGYGTRPSSSLSIQFSHF